MSTIWLRQILYSKTSGIIFPCIQWSRKLQFLKLSLLSQTVTRYWILCKKYVWYMILRSIIIKKIFKQYSNYRKGWYSTIPVIFRRCFFVHGEMPLLERLENNHSGITLFCNSKYFSGDKLFLKSLENLWGYMGRWIRID